MAAGLHPSLTAAADAMVRTLRVVEPNAAAHARYDGMVGQYEATYEGLKEASHRLVKSLG